VCAPIVAALLAGASAACAADVSAAAAELPGPLTAEPGDAARGRSIVASRSTGLCLLCHAGPIPEEPFQGNLGPDLAGVGRRLSAGELRRQLLDPRAMNPGSIMPAVHRTEGLTRVARTWKDKPVLTSQQVEDVVAYLRTLQ
jgi:sulfur-oxidizing protein SoxX